VAVGAISTLRFTDGGAFIDTPMLVTRSTGVITFTNQVNMTGLLNCTTSLGCQISVPAGNRAEYVCIVAGQRNWSMGEFTDGTWRVADNTAGLARLNINATGDVTVVSGALMPMVVPLILRVAPGLSVT
jgi:hypothetical protein